MRTQKAITNIKMAMIYQISVLFMSFVDRKLFLEILGIEYLGVHGLFNNMISMLALAELGVGTAIIYNLYKPLAEQDEGKVAALMKFYRKMYFYIGGIILVIGFLMLDVLPSFVKDVSLEMHSIRIAYSIFVIGTVGTYWTGYKRSLLYADQKNYKVLVGDMSATIGGAFMKILVLITYPSYILYVWVHIISKITPNLYAAYKVNQDYPYLKGSKEKLGLEEKQLVKKNVKDLFIHKVSFFVVNSTDNLLISWFSGVTVVGIIGNYQVIVSAVMSFIGQGIEALQASIGNMVTTQEEKAITAVYEKVEFVVFWIASWSVVCLLGLINPFIKLWLGTEYLISQPIMWVMIFNFMLWVLTRPLWQMMSVSGLFKEDKYNALAEMLVNLVISLILVQKIGVIGVLIGTSLSYLVAWFLKARVLYSKFFKEGFKAYMIRMITYMGIIVLEVVLTQWALEYVVVEKPLLTFVLRAAVCMVLPNVINSLIFYKHKHFIYFKALIKEQVQKVQFVHRYDGILEAAIVTLIMIIPLHNTAFPIGSLIGRFSSVALAMIGMGYIIYQGVVLGHISKKRQKHVMAYLIFGVVLIIFGMVTGGDEGLKMAANIISVTCIGVACALMDWSKLRRGIYLADVGILIWLIAAFKDVTGLAEGVKHQFIFGNPNHQGAFCVFMIGTLAILYALSQGERYLLYLVLFVPFLNLTGSRTSQLAFVVGLCCYIIWLFTSKWRVTHYGLLILAVLGIGLITIIYPQLTSGEYAAGFNEWIKEFTGKNLFSGREVMWQQAIEVIKGRPLIGYGLHTQVQEGLIEQFYAWRYGAHNEFLQVVIWAGGIGISGMVSTLAYLWHCLYKGRQSKLTRVGASLFMMMLVMATFENMLLGEVIPFSMIQWILLGIGVSAVKNMV